MPSKKYGILLLASALVAFEAKAASSNVLPVGLGGGLTCAEYIKRIGSTDDALRLSTMMYVAGYISGTITQENFEEIARAQANLMDPEIVKNLGQRGHTLVESKTNVAVFINKWMINYCTVNKNADLTISAQEFSEFLGLRL